MPEAQPQAQPVPPATPAPVPTTAGPPTVGPTAAPAMRPRGNRSRASEPGAGTALVGGLPLSRRNLVISGLTATAAAVGTGKVLLSGAEQASGTTLAKAPTASGTTSAGATSAQPSSSASATAAPAGFALAKNLDPSLLISRATYGRTGALDEEIDRLGPTAWLNRQLAPTKIKDAAGGAVTATFPRLRWSPTTARSNLKEGDWALMTDTVAAHLGYAIWSERQLYEVMVDLWSNHLNITCPSGDVWDSRHSYQLNVIRKYALGSFEQMLLASAFHPAMLVYLNNAQSTGATPNENYAREVLELHTVGVDGGYTERDVQRAALLLTGWTVNMSRAAYVPGQHHVGSIRVMGFRASNSSMGNGPAAQRAYLQYLARHPKTAANIATKLAQRFVSDSPPQALIKRLAASYTKNHTQIVPVLRELFASPEFTESKGEKLRRPMEQVVASARVIGVQRGNASKGLSDLYWMLTSTGHAPLSWAMPNGYADVASAWQSPAAALETFNTTASIVQGWWPTALKLPGPKKLLLNPPHTRSTVIDMVAHKMLGRGPTAAERSAALTLLAGTKLHASFTTGSWDQLQSVALTTTLFLSSPAHLTR